MSGTKTLTTQLQELREQANGLPNGGMYIFWETFLQSHAFYNAFSSGRFDFDTLWPTRDIEPDESIQSNAGQRMFYDWSKGNCDGSLKERLDKCGVKINLSKVTSISSIFNYGQFTELPLLDLSTITAETGLQGAFANCWNRLKWIEGLISSENTYWHANAFHNDYGITHCPIQGTIGAGEFNMKSCNKLDKESLQSIMIALSDNSTGLTATLSLEAVNKAFETSKNAADGSTSPEWTALVAAKPNWTITLS